MLKLADRSEGELLFQAVGYLKEALFFIDNGDPKNSEFSWGQYIKVAERMAKELKVPQKRMEDFIIKMERRS